VRGSVVDSAGKGDGIAEVEALAQGAQVVVQRSVTHDLEARAGNGGAHEGERGNGQVEALDRNQPPDTPHDGRICRHGNLVNFRDVAHHVHARSRDPHALDQIVAAGHRIHHDRLGATEHPSQHTPAHTRQSQAVALQRQHRRFAQSSRGNIGVHVRRVEEAVDDVYAVGGERTREGVPACHVETRTALQHGHRDSASLQRRSMRVLDRGKHVDSHVHVRTQRAREHHQLFLGTAVTEIIHDEGDRRSSDHGRDSRGTRRESATSLLLGQIRRRGRVRATRVTRLAHEHA